MLENVLKVDICNLDYKIGDIVYVIKHKKLYRCIQIGKGLYDARKTKYSYNKYRAVECCIFSIGLHIGLVDREFKNEVEWVKPECFSFYNKEDCIIEVNRLMDIEMDNLKWGNEKFKDLDLD